MLRKTLHSKIHMATVTGANPDYVGSITIDADILLAIGLRTSDAVTVANCRSGARFETYVFLGEPGSGAIELNGAAAHLVEVGDKLIIMHYALMDEGEYAAHCPRVAIVDDANAIVRTIEYQPGPDAGGAR